MLFIERLDSTVQCHYQVSKITLIGDNKELYEVRLWL